MAVFRQLRSLNSIAHRRGNWSTIRNADYLLLPHKKEFPFVRRKRYAKFLLMPTKANSFMGDNLTSESNSVSRWIAELRLGNTQAACELWKRFSDRVVLFARSELNGIVHMASDEEDVALSVFHVVFHGVQNGRYMFLQDRTQLWRLLVRITKSKSNSLKRHEWRDKRGGRDKQQTQSLDHLDIAELLGDAALQADTPTPLEAAELAEELAFLMLALRDDCLREVTRLTLEGYSTAEIAQRLGVADRTIRRKLELIRSTWEQAAKRTEHGSP
jgi:DNA-directed RNA polymerase specialized sigma24 family protein